MLTKHIHIAYFLNLDRFPLVELRFLEVFFHDGRSVQYLSANDSIQNALCFHDESWPDFIQLKFLFVFCYKFSINLEIPETYFIPLSNEIQTMVDDSSAFWMIFRNVEGSNQ